MALLRLQMFSVLAVALLCSALTLSTAADAVGEDVLLAEDDECASGDAQCSMNALQMKAQVGNGSTTTAAPAAKSADTTTEDPAKTKAANKTASKMVDDVLGTVKKAKPEGRRRSRASKDLKAAKDEHDDEHDKSDEKDEEEEEKEKKEEKAYEKEQKKAEEQYEKGLEEEFQEALLDAECPLIAREGSNCYDAVQYVAKTAIKDHPEWFPHLTPDAAFVDFQRALFKMNQGDCLDPCPRPLKYCTPDNVRQEARVMDPDECLCVFDVDRTLTGAQGDTEKCPADTLVPGVFDDAYDKGNFTPSGLGSAGVHKTFCRHCYKSIVTAGDVMGIHSKERLYIQYHTLADDLPSRQARFMDKLGWSAASIPWTLGNPNITSVTSPYVYLQKDGTKQHAVDAVVNWYRLNNVNIDCRNVFFFDDRFSNVGPFEVTPFNAKQISCDARDPKHPGVGLCGATLTEITDRFSGVKLCKPY